MLMDTGMTPFAAEVEDPVTALSEVIGGQMPQGWFKLVQLAAAGSTAAGATGSGPAADAAGPAAASHVSSADGDHAGAQAGGYQEYPNTTQQRNSTMSSTAVTRRPANVLPELWVVFCRLCSGAIY